MAIPDVDPIRLGGNESHIPGIRPRRTPDAELREAVERLTECQARTLDALMALCGAMAELPPADHVRYRSRLLGALGALDGQLDEARAILLGEK